MLNFDRYSHFIQPLESRRENQRLRSLTPVSGSRSRTRITVGGKECINFCSNDYLGLAGHPELIERSVSFTKEFGCGSSASRLISGSLDLHHHFEGVIADLYERESALLFASGFQANSTVLPALAGKGDLILADKLVHNSLIQGGLSSRAEFRRFRHNDPGHLDELLIRLDRKRYRSVWVVTESIFSMDGDIAPLDDIIEICQREGALLYVDDAHALGVRGSKGLGLTSGRPEIDLVVGTLGKAAGSFGGFVVTSRTIKEWLVNFCSGFIYSTALPPAVTGAALAAFELIPNMERERDYLSRMILQTRHALRSLGYDTGGSDSQIIPLILDDEDSALGLSEKLFKKGVYVQAVRPPAVNRSRLRITLSAAHSESDIKKLTDALKNG